MVRLSRDINKKTLVRLTLSILIIGFAVSLGAGLLLDSAFAVEKRPTKSKVKRSSVNKTPPPPPPVVDESFLEQVKEYIGIPYRWGGASKKGMDCSGFVRHVYSKTFSLDLPHSSYRQYSLPIMKKVPVDNLQTGDLIFFSPKGKRINHVGIYLDDGNFIHAGRKSGVTISSLDNRYWKLRMVGAKRPAGVWGYQGKEDARSLAGVEIALNDSGEITQATADNGSDLLTLNGGLRPLSWCENPSLMGLREGLIHTFGLQVSRSFGKSSWSMSLLQESHFRHLSDATTDDLFTRPAYALSERQYTLDRHLQGVKMASNIHPADWLQITPSFTYVGHETNLEGDAPAWGPGLGLAIRIRPLPARWSFSADLQYWDESERPGGFNEIDTWKRSNLSLTFGYDFSDALKLSIVGQHGMGNLFNNRQAYSDNRQEHNGFFLGLDWAF